MKNVYEAHGLKDYEDFHFCADSFNEIFIGLGAVLRCPPDSIKLCADTSVICNGK